MVVLSGATALTNGGGATVTLNAGTLKVNSTLSGAAGASLTSTRGNACRRPAGSIQVPVTINGGGILLPDATAASTALIGNSLTISGGGAFQWVYSSSGAKGTLALGSASWLSGLQYSRIPPAVRDRAARGHLRHDLEHRAGQSAGLELRRFAYGGRPYSHLGGQQRQLGHRLELDLCGLHRGDAVPTSRPACR